jgi:predicted metal-dependent phosphoesterase TrpH
MHVHTVYSHDGYLTLESLDGICRRRGITTIAITDHNEIAGALQAVKLHKAGRFRTNFIVGEEISTTEGEIIGLFLHEKIPAGMSMSETLAEIRKQGGLVYLNHPFGYSARAGCLNIDALDELWDRIDIIEVFNGRNVNQWANTLAGRLARTRGKPAGAGSDAHSRWEVGRTFVEISDFDTPAEFLNALRHANCTCNPCSIAYRIAFKGRKMFLPRPVPKRLAS